MSAWRPAADDGVLLMYRVPGYLHPRAEAVILSGQVETGVMGGSAEVRQVRTWASVLDWTPQEAYEETAISANLGPIGVEWTSNRGETQPSFGLDLPLGDVQLQPGQLMGGFTNPLGPGGGRIGAEWRVESVQTFITTRGYLDNVGGVPGFGAAYLPEDARLWRQGFIFGMCTRQRCYSGIERLRIALFATEYPHQERP